MHIIKDEELSSLIHPILKDFISLCGVMTNMPEDEVPRYLINRLYCESLKCEELVDSYGAPKNTYWLPLRISIATTKAFSFIVYGLIHVNISAPNYHLLPLDDDFMVATRKAIKLMMRSLYYNACNTMGLVQKMNMNHDLHTIQDYDFSDCRSEGMLDADRKKREVEDPDRTVVYLATTMLNISEESSWLEIYKTLKPSDYAKCFPEMISEERLRALADKFHNLQSLYDTYLSGSDIAEKDSMLPVMRGNLTVVYHLLDTSVTLAHFYERHRMRDWTYELRPPISRIDLLDLLINYFITYSCKYIKAARNLCRDILKNYAVYGDIVVPVPNHRGFHVRPSTLISKIVIHYGSDVTMEFGDTKYDASQPLELFRANEALNKLKRDTVVEYVMIDDLIKHDASGINDSFQMKDKLRMIFIDLLEKKKIINLKNDFSFKDIDSYKDETLAEFVKRAITQYLAMGKIDIVRTDTVKFHGDLRVLEDIKILAESGYGEDKFGNNIVLPKQLSYLSRATD